MGRFRVGAPQPSAAASRRGQYAQKLEVYDPRHGAFGLVGARYRGADYHHVSLDLQAHVRGAAGEVGAAAPPPPPVPRASLQLRALREGARRACAAQGVMSHA